MSGKQEFRFGFREANKDQAGRGCGQQHTYKYFDGGYGTAVERCRGHIAVTHRGQRFNAEKECVDQRPGRQVNDRTRHRKIQHKQP